MSLATRRIKSSFTAGELAPELYGRTDLRAFENGARQLRNVVIQPTGGVARRPGLVHVATLPGPARLMPFEFNTEQTYLLAHESPHFQRLRSSLNNSSADRDGTLLASEGRARVVRARG